MTKTPPPQLRRGWTTGACATAAVQAALYGLWEGRVPPSVQITLPRGETPVFEIAQSETGKGWASAGVIKDAGDDPDVTHGALVCARVEVSDHGVIFKGGQGIGRVTKPGLPIAVGEPAINPVPRSMMQAVVSDTAARLGETPDVTITLSIPDGAELALQTWNPRLGILGGLSVLGTTGIVRPFSCAAWIASIHRGIDVARAEGRVHVAGCTGATSEKTVQGLYDLADTAMLDMGDFVGGLLKYLARHPVPRITIGGGIGKMTKLAQGARDLHSGRSQVDFAALALALHRPEVATMNTALQAYERVGDPMAAWVATNALETIRTILPGRIAADVVVIDRRGKVLARA